MSRVLTPAISYIRSLYAKEDELLQSIRTQLRETMTGWQVGAEEGRLLAWLITLHGSKKIVELGTLGGYSAIWMAQAMAVDGHLYTLERDAVNAGLARRSFAEAGLNQRITLLEGDAHQTLASLAASGPFDLLFIDADKLSYPAYLDWAEQHLRIGGLLIADNTLLFDAVYQDTPPAGTAPLTWAAMRRFNERLADTTRWDATMIPTQDGLSVAIFRGLHA